MTTVRAPFAGVVAARNLERGDRVVGASAAASPLFEINALDPPWVLVDVPQGAVLQVRPDCAPRSVSRNWRAKASSACRAEHRRGCRRHAGGAAGGLRLPNPDGRIPAGMVGEVSLPVPRAAPASVT